MAVSANIFYKQPSERMVVIGVTGTNGKSSTVSLIARVLEEAGHKVGATSTTLFKIGDKEWLNDKKMTMVGRFQLQKLLSQMVMAGCSHAVIETSSQGIEQFRHLGINYDVAVFTNLAPEHIEAHGGFENYKRAKQKLFARLSELKKKKLGGREVDKVIVVNGDDKHSDDFSKFKADHKIRFGMDGKQGVVASELSYKADGIGFTVDSTQFNLKLFGGFNVYNSLSAIAVSKGLGIDIEVCKKALEKVESIPGRMEFINEGQVFKVLVDYAPEPESVKQLYKTIDDHNFVSGKLIHVLGSCGGGRDVVRRPILGKMAGEKADYVIITNEDPYDDDPMEIIDSVVGGAIESGKVLDKNLFKIIDRREAIEKAVSLADEGDLVLLTGKGSEQAIVLAGGKKMKWDEREVVREVLKLK